MSRLLIAALLAVGVAAPAFAQGLRDSTPTPLYRPGNPFVPAISQFGPQAALPGAVTPIRPWRGPIWGGPVWGGPVWGGWGGVYNPYFASPYTWGWGMGEPTMDYGRPLVAPPLQGVGGSAGTELVINPELAAELTVELPAVAKVTLNGRAVDTSGKTVTLSSPQLKAGETYTFDVKANWTTDGRQYMWERVVTLGSGERSKMAVARGFPIKD
jgi:uncharacterized protein (TIGR03000 family)